MPLFPELSRYDREELQRVFLSDREPKVPEEEEIMWLEEVAIKIAKTGPKGVDFLFSYVPDADELRLRAILLSLSMLREKLASRKRASLCKLARRLLCDARPMVVAEAVDTLRHLSYPAATKSVFHLLNHPSPYVVGSALRFVAHQEPEKAVPLLENALRSKEPIVRENAVDELDDLNYVPALPKIKRLLRDPNENVRQAARYAVAHLQEAAR